MLTEKPEKDYIVLKREDLQKIFQISISATKYVCMYVRVWVFMCVCLSKLNDY